MPTVPSSTDDHSPAVHGEAGPGVGAHAERGTSLPGGPRRRGARSSRLPGLGGLVRLVLSVALLAVLMVGAPMIPGMVSDKIGDIVSSLNPFAETTVDRTGPSVIYSLNQLSEFKAASAYLETVVDLENDSKLPSWVSGERVIYVGKGNVEAVVDFGGLDERRVTLSEDGRSATVRLPAPTVGEPVLDLEASYVAHRDVGVVDRFKGSDSEREAQLRAIEQMTRTAAAGSGLVDMAENSTTATLKGLLGALGYTDVTVAYDE